MAQYTEGQKLKGSDGNIYVVRNGAPVLAAPAPLIANPAQPLDLQGKALSNQRTQQEIDAANATAAANATRARAEAESARIKAQQDQEAYDASHPKKLDSTIVGPAFLNTLSLPDREIVQALGDGRLAFPGGFALKAPWWQQKLEQVGQAFPDFDATNFNNRAKARAILLSGKVGSSANALNTAIGHVGHLSDQISGTASHNFVPFNAVENLLSQTFGGAGVTNYKDTAQKLADELESVYRNGGGAEQGVVRQLQSLDPNASREQKVGVIRNALELLASKQAANLYQYNIGSGGKPEVDLLDPAARKVLDQFPDIRDKYFAPNAAPLSNQAVALLTHNGGTPPPAQPSNGDNGSPPPGGGYDPTNRGGVSPITGGAGSRTEPDPEASALIDSLVSSNTPYGPAIRQFRQQFPNASPLAPSQYNDALAYHAKHPNETTGYGAAVRDVPLSYGDQFANALADSAPGALALRANDAAFGGLPSALAGGKGQYFRDLTSQEHSTASALGDIGGAVAGTIGIGKGLKAATPLFERALPKRLAGFLASPGGRAATADTLYGGTFGATQNPDDPVSGAAKGSLAMLAGNGVGRLVVGPALAAAGTTGIGQKALGMFGSTATKALPSAEGTLARQAGANADSIFSNLNEAANLNLPYSLADANPQLRMLAGSAVRKSPVVRQLAEDTILPRQLGQADRAISAIDTHLAPTADLSQISSDAMTRAQAASRPLYEKAMQAPPPSDAKLTELMNTPAGQSAAREAYTIALNKGESPGDLSFHPLDDGSVAVDGNPNWRTLQYMKQGVDSVVEKARNPTTGQLNLKDPSIRGLSDFRNQFTNRLHVLNPDLQAADNAFANFAKQGTAANMGASATSRMVTPDAVAGIVANTAPEHLPFYQQGFASSLANKVDNAPFASDPYRLIYGSPAQQAKIGSVFPQGAPTFGRVNALEGDMSRTAGETLGGSPTAARMEADKLFENGPANLAGDLAFTAATGTPTPGLIKTGFRTMAGDAFRLGLGKSAQNRAEQLGPMLLNTDPAASADNLRQLLDLAAARREYMARARTAGGMFAAPLAAPLIAN
jgi:hypothetical protein